MRPAIRAENLSKQYVLTGGPRVERNLQETLLHGLGSAWRTMTRQQTDQRSFWALKDVSFEIQPGEVVGVIGRNGAGKSTLLKILSRIVEPSAGRAELRGRLGSLLEVGTGFHPELTGRENVFLNGSLLGMSRSEIRGKFDEIVAFADIADFLDTPVKRYSTGMHVRLAFAIAAHLNPEILVLDEVLAVGDAQFQKKCLGKMQDVSRQGRTVLFVSHDMSAVRRLCSRAILIAHGGVAANGPADEVATRYLATGRDLMLPGERIDLQSAKRRGSGAARFTAASIHGANDDAAANVVGNGSMDVHLWIHADAPREVDSLAVSLTDRSGAKLLNADTISLGRPIYLQAGENRVHLHIKSVPLNPGVFSLGLTLMKRPVAMFDSIESACEVEIFAPPGDTRVRPNADGLVWTDFDLVEAK